MHAHTIAHEPNSGWQPTRRAWSKPLALYFSFTVKVTACAYALVCMSSSEHASFTTHVISSGTLC